MQTMREKLADVRASVEDLKGAALFNKAAMAERVIEQVIGLLDDLVEAINNSEV